MKWHILDMAIMTSIVLAACIKGGDALQTGQTKKEKMGWTMVPGGGMSEARQVDIDLEEAVGKNEILRVRKLLAKGANPNYAIRPPLFAIHGTQKQVLDMANLLVENGAKVNAASYMNGSILTKVLQEYEDRQMDPDPEVLIRFFLAKGAKTNALNYRGEAPLHVAASYGYTKCVRMLLESHADPNARQIADIEFLADAETQKFYSRIWEPGYQESGITPLHSAIGRNSNLEIARMLIKAGADATCKDVNGWTILHYAAHCRNVEAVQFCLDQGIPVDSLSKFGSTPLKLGIAERLPDENPKMVALLIGHGANPNQRMPNGKLISDIYTPKAKDELKHLAFDPNYADGMNMDETLANMNAVLKMLNPKAALLVMPKPPVDMDGIHYSPMEWHEVLVSRVVKVEKSCVSLVLGFKCLASIDGHMVAVRVQNLRLGKASPKIQKDIRLEVAKGRTKTVRLEFPKSSSLDHAIHCTYKTSINGGFSGSGGTF